MRYGLRMPLAASQQYKQVQGRTAGRVATYASLVAFQHCLCVVPAYVSSVWVVRNANSAANSSGARQYGNLGSNGNTLHAMPIALLCLCS